MNPELLRTWDRDHVWHPFTQMESYAQELPPLIVSAEGFFLIDSEGNRYLDGVSSLWCNLHGHRVPEIDQAIRGQLDLVAHSTLLGLGNGPSAELAHELVQRAPKGLKRVFFSDAGATAVEIALKIAFQYHQQKGSPEQRPLFVTLGGAYHGDTLGAVSVGGVELFHSLFAPLLFPTLKLPSPVALRYPAGFTRNSYLQYCFDEVERQISENKEQIAAVILEPMVQGAAGILVHPEGYYKHVREVTKKHGILLIADEVAVGFGRLGPLFASEIEGVSPDLLCLAKGLTGGYLPLAATLATEELFEAFLGPPQAGRQFFHGHTYCGNPLGCAAALASLRLFEANGVSENVSVLERAIRVELFPLHKSPHVAEIRQRGVMVGIELVGSKHNFEEGEQDQEGSSPGTGGNSAVQNSERFPPELRVGHRVVLAARKRGVIVRPLGDVIVLMPPPAMPVELVRSLCRLVKESIAEVLKDLASHT